MKTQKNDYFGEIGARRAPPPPNHCKPTNGVPSLLGGNFHFLSLFLSDKKEYFWFSDICSVNSRDIMPVKTTTFAADNINILLVISLFLFTPSVPLLSIFSTYKSSCEQIK